MQNEIINSINKFHDGEFQERPFEGSEFTLWLLENNSSLSQYTTHIHEEEHWETRLKYLPSNIIGWSEHTYWKIVAVSNFNDETFIETSICEKIHNYNHALQIKTMLNLHLSNDGPTYHTIKRNDYVLWKGMEEFT